MDTNKCSICKNESSDMWLLNLAEVDSLSYVEGKNIRQYVCNDCTQNINRVVKDLSGETAMSKAFNKAGVRPQNIASVNNMGHKNNSTKGAIQNSFLDDLIKNKRMAQIDAEEGIGWRGFIKAYDDFSIIVINEQSQKKELVFKHAIKSIRSVED